MSQNLLFVLIPVVAAILGAVLTANLLLSERVVSAFQHLAAGVVFAAAASEILPELKHSGAALPVVIGGGLGVVVMLGIKQLEERVKGPVGLASTIAIDLLVDGVALGLSFAAGARAGILLTVALTLEVLFLGVTVTSELAETITRKTTVVLLTAGLVLMMPVGVAAAIPLGALPPAVLTGCFAFALVALLYLVTEELLVEAHEKPDTPLISAMFFVGFLALLLLDDLVS